MKEYIHNYDNLVENDITETVIRMKVLLINSKSIILGYKRGIYQFPGGHLEENETFKDCIKREVLEETGCEVEIIETLGTIEEHKTLDNFKQISYVFIGKVLKDTNELKVTEKEKDEGAKLIWETPERALELITECFGKLVASKYESVYHTKFIVFRDRKILEKYIELNKEKNV